MRALAPQIDFLAPIFVPSWAVPHAPSHDAPLVVLGQPGTFLNFSRGGEAVVHEVLPDENVTQHLVLADGSVLDVLPVRPPLLPQSTYREGSLVEDTAVGGN